ncbi:MAG: hypothetical protein ACLQO7_14635 [Candidatus Bathyarchaeia archaeon]
MKEEKQTNCRAEKVILEIEKAARRDFLPIVGPNRGKILADEVRKAKPIIFWKLTH